MRRYLERARGRFALSLAALPDGARVLELGADPWFFSQLLAERGRVPVTCGQRPGVWLRDESMPAVQEIAIAWGGRSVTLEHHLFDAERDLWPFADGSFDVVVCMEVIEHLTYSPSHLLHEANRVLADGGSLLLTTPNAVSGTRLAAMLCGRSRGGAYSAYGPTGRHNREFTAGELEALLSAANFAPRVAAENLAGYEAPDVLGRLLQAWGGASRRDHLVATAVKTGPPVLALPGWLYNDVDPARMRAGGVALV